MFYRPEDGQLLIRLRPETDGPGWEVLARTTPRPLSARPWRLRCTTLSVESRILSSARLR